MAKIKTRDAVKGTIKTIDKAAIAAERMKSAYAKTKVFTSSINKVRKVYGLQRITSSRQRIRLPILRRNGQ